MRGEKNPKAKLNAAKVLNARQMVRMGISLKVIAHEFNCDISTVSLAATRKTWKHLR